MRVGPYAIGSLDVVVERIRVADVDGFPIVWTHQALGINPFVAMAVAGREAPRIEIGTALVPAVLRHPQGLAAEALTAQAAIGGRLTLGVGISHPHVVEGRLGMSYERPAEYMREYLEALLPLLRGETADVRGRWLDHDRRARCRRRRAAAGRAARRTGSAHARARRRLTDGTVTAAKNAHAGSPNGSCPRSAEGRLGCRPPTAAYRLGRRRLHHRRRRPGAEQDRRDIEAWSATMPAFKQMLEREEVTSQVDLGLIGDEETARAQARRFIDAGATESAVREAPGTPEEAERTCSFLRSLLEE